MATIAMATADIQDTSMLTISGASPISSEQARTGTYSYKTDYGKSIAIPIDPISTIYGKACIYVTIPHDNASSGTTIRIRESTSSHVIIVIPGTGELKVYRGDSSTLLGTTSGANVVINKWSCIEFKIYIHDTAGTVDIKVNGIAVLSLTSIDTKYVGSGICDNVQVAGGSSGIAYFDDIVLDDANYPGVGGLEVIPVDGDGTYTGWTASAGSDYQCVDDNPPNDATDYVSTDAATPDTKESFTMAAMSVTPDAIPRIGIFIKTQLSAAGSGTLTPMYRSNSTDVSLSAGGLSTSWAWVIGYDDADAGDGDAAWTEAKINAIEVGFVTSA